MKEGRRASSELEKTPEEKKAVKYFSSTSIKTSTNIFHDLP